MTIKVKPSQGFDSSKLAAMSEPLTVRVERLKGNMRTPVELPGKDGAGPGTLITGLTRDDVLQLEKTTLAVAGGGMYVAKVSDLAGDLLEWNFGWALPERAAAGAEFVAPPIPAPTAQQPAGFGSTGSSWGMPYAAMMPPALPIQAPSQPGWPSPWGMPQWQAGFGSPSAGYGWGSPAATPIASSGSQELRQIQDELSRERAARLEDRHRAELERLNRAHEDQMAALSAKIDASRAPSGPDPIVLQLKEELVREREERRRAEERADRERVERASEERHRAEMQAIRDEIKALAAVGTVNRVDPVVEFMKDSSRQNAEITKEIARSSQAALDRQASSAIQPLQVIDMLDRRGNVAEQMLQTLGNGYKQLFELSQMTSQPEHPAVDLIKNGISTAKAMAQRYMAMKQSEDQSKAAIAQVSAQADAIRAQAAAQIATAQGPQAQPLPSPVPPPAQFADPGPAVVPEPPSATPSESIKSSNGAPTEADMFGPAMGDVQRLRLGVKQGLLPEQVYAAIMQGITMVETQKLEIPAFMIYAGGHFPEFVELLLPNAPQAMKDAVVEIMRAQARMDAQIRQTRQAALDPNGPSEEGDEDEDVDEDVDEDDEDADQPAA